jgi:putative FmdB family regulatory protein
MNRIQADARSFDTQNFRTFTLGITQTGLRLPGIVVSVAPQTMPNYDYECRTCGKRFEVFQSMNDPKLSTCIQPDCDGEVRRLLGTGGGIIFKGSGFYQTDYRSSSYQAGVKADGGSAPKSSPPAAATPAAPAAKSAD